MKYKLQQIQLFTLFLITLLSISFFYANSLPDNMYEISSSSSDYNIFTYFFSSILATASNYIGPWVALAFGVYTFFYAFVYVKRNYWLDQFAPMALVIFSFTLSREFFPELMGAGLIYATKNLGMAWSLTLLFLSLTSFLAITFRSSFKEIMKQIGISLKNKMYEFFNYILNFGKKQKENLGKLEVSQFKNKVTVRTVQGLIQASKQKKDISSSDVSEPKIEQSNFSEINNSVIKLDSDTVIEPLAEQEINSLNEVVGVQNSNLNQEINQVKKEFIPLTKKSMPEISSSELIHCISVGKEKKSNSSPDDEYFEQIITSLEEKLIEFKIDASIVGILKGPVVDTFELELGPGVKVSRINNVQQELSLSLSGIPIRIVYPMKGKSTVGIEVPRQPREMIYIEDVLEDRSFMESNKHLPIAMGKDAFGEALVVDLAKMPHMLVAGATGAGKSVFVNTLLVSLLVKLSPEKLKLILIDPKQLELALYSNLPHLIMPVITEAKLASLSLLWAVQEMERRYSIMKEMQVRNIEGFNEKVVNATPIQLQKIHQFYEDQDGKGYELPYIVIIVDEFADLILTKLGKDIEVNICRLAAKARASGIHIVLATQRPSVDVITGLIKSNFPTRVSFRVTSPQDSRTILNEQGGEKLLGNGDMLFKQVGETKRVHSAYIDEQEIEKLTDQIIANYGSADDCFDETVLNFLENGGEFESNFDGETYTVSSDGTMGSSSDLDPKFHEAVRVVAELRKASASMLQRRLGVGYNRAANLIEMMEEKGIVGPQQGSKPREVMVRVEDL